MGSYNNLSEEDTRAMFIDPIINKKWTQEQVRRETCFTDGRIIVRGKMVTRAQKKKTDYLLYDRPNHPIAIIEAKKYDEQVGTGMQQAIEYAEILDVPFTYSTNGQGFLEHDMITGAERELNMEDFPTPVELWNRYKIEKNITQEEETVISVPYYYQEGSKKPRYYQRIAINRTIEAIAHKQKRLLLVMATGTGKTYTSFQIIHRYRKAFNNGTKNKRILYLADRNILIDQTMAQDFQPFNKYITKVEHKELDSSYEIYMALYQQLTDGNGNDTFKDFDKDFFDLIVVDECHRGSASEDSNWRRILEYFESATQVGLTATPKETKNVSNIDYFGEPIYTYSLKQGIDDGFLAPYKVMRINLDKDLLGYIPRAGQKDIYGNEIEQREYTTMDFDKNLIIDDRTKKVAEEITNILKDDDRFSKTIVFCIDIEHAERMRQALVNENKDLVKENPKYIMRITGDNKEGKAQLDNFIDVDTKYPTIVTTSKLMTTGVDCKTCKYIVLDTNISSMTEFKQIVGRGTRIREDKGKTFFTIIDFRNATRLFQDKEFDDTPIQSEEFDKGYTPKNPTSNVPNILDTQPVIDTSSPSEHKKYRINDVEVTVMNKMIQYYDKDGKLVTESLIDFSKRSILNEYSDLGTFINRWNREQKKEVIIEELEKEGILLEALREEVGKKDISDFDLILHVAYDKKPLTKQERANNVIKRGYLYKYSEPAQRVLAMLLQKYQDSEIKDLTDTKILQLRPFDEYDNPMNIVKLFGGKVEYIKAVEELENELYVG